MKRNFYKVIQFLFAIILLVSVGCFAGCFSNTDDNSVVPSEDDTSATLTLNQSSINAIIGDKISLSVTNKRVFTDVTWSSENTAVAKIDANGVVEAYSEGTTYLVATSQEQEAKCLINVSTGNMKPELIIENERELYSIAKDTNFPLDFYVLFNGKKYYDFTLTSNCDSANLSFSENTIVPSVVSTGNELNVSCSWRNFNFSSTPSLNKTIKINVVENASFYVNGKQISLIELYTIDEVKGTTYQTNFDFVPSFIINGQQYNNVSVTLPDSDIVSLNQEKLNAEKFGQGVIALSCEVDNVTYNSAVKIDVIRPEISINKKFRYFSAVTGEYKDTDNGYSNESIIEELFGTTTVENLNVYQDNKLISYSNGKVLDAKTNKDSVLNSKFVFETDKVVFKTNVDVYALVIQDKEDLKNFEINILTADNPATADVDETVTSYVDGYCELINNVDATGIKISHTALTNDKINYNRYSTGAIGKFGFTGCFNGNGYTISNLDTSVESGNGGGLFGYVLGSSTIQNVGFKDLKASNSSGLGYIAYTQANSGEYDNVKLGKMNISNVYISLSSDTVNPKGALFNTISDVWMGNYIINNVVVDASQLAYNEGSNVSLLFANYVANYATTVYGTTSRNDIIVITNNYPIAKSGTSKLYGENLANGTALNNSASIVNADSERYTKLVDKIYASGIQTYNNINELIAAKPNLKSFDSTMWIANGGLIFKSAKDVVLKVDGSLTFNDLIAISSTTNGKKIELVTYTGEEVQIDSIEYNDSKLTVDANNKITLKNLATSIEEYQVTLKYTLKGVQKEQIIIVVGTPVLIENNQAIEIASLDNNFDYRNYIDESKVFDGNAIIEAKQTVNGVTTDLTVNGNILLGLQVKIKDDYSDVLTSTIEITTSVTTYKFTNVKIYSKLISKAEDLAVFAQNSDNKKVTGYYKMLNSIDMAGTGVAHDTSKLSYDTTKNFFQGVFDGQGNIIYNFKPNLGGLFGTIYSANDNNGGKTVIRNVAFIGVQSQKNATPDNGAHDFAILSKYILNGNDAISEISNIYVNIANTYLNEYLPASNYKGLIYSNSLDKLNTFKMTNVLVEIENEEYSSTVNQASGTIITRDSQIINSTLEERSARFENVITIAKNSPCVYRQWVGDGFAKEFGEYMYFVYAENDIGGEGLRCGWLEEEGNAYPHNPIAENKAIGSYIYNNVYRYDTRAEIANAQIEKLVATGYWKLSGTKLMWITEKVSKEPTGEEENFNIDWLN